MHSWYTDPVSRGQAPFFLRYTLIAYIAPVLDDMRNVETYVARDAPEIDYTFVLPPGLSNKPLTGGFLKKFISAWCVVDSQKIWFFSFPAKDFQVEEDKWCVSGAASMVARADVARFIMKIVQEDSYKRKIVAMATN